MSLNGFSMLITKCLYLNSISLNGALDKKKTFLFKNQFHEIFAHLWTYCILFSWMFGFILDNCDVSMNTIRGHMLF